MLLRAAVCISLAALSWAQDSDIPTIEAALKKAAIIPDVLPSNFTPAFPIEVVFQDPFTNSTIPVTAGMNLTMNETANIPFFAIRSNNTQIIGKPYLIAMVDPDAPSPPNRTNAQILHFLGINYVSQSLTDNELFILSNNSAPIMPFTGPHPPNGSIPHRYTVVMYLQASDNVTVVNGTVPADRVNFNLTTFVEKTGNLTLLGATFFFVGPGNSTANNSVTGDSSLSAILSSPSATTTTGVGGGNSSTILSSPSATAAAGTGGGNGTAAGGNGTGRAAGLDFVVPAIWSASAILFGAAAYMV